MKALLFDLLNKIENGEAVIKTIKESNLPTVPAYDYAIEHTNSDVIRQANKLVDMGIKESIDNLKKTTTYQKPRVKLMLEQLEGYLPYHEQLNLIQSYVSVLEQNSHDIVFLEEMQNMMSNINDLARYSNLVIGYMNSKNDTQSKSVKESSAAILEMIIEDTKANESIFMNISESAKYNKNISNLSNYLNTTESTSSAQQSDYELSDIFALTEGIDADKILLHFDKNNFVLNIKESELGLAEESDMEGVSESYSRIANLMDVGVITVSENVNYHAEKLVTITESGDIIIGGKNVLIPEGTQLAYILRELHGINPLHTKNIIEIKESIGNFGKMDESKKITSRYDESKSFTVVKLQNSILGLKNNTKIASTPTISSYKVDELKDTVLEHMNFNIESVINEMFEVEQVLEAKVSERKAKILKQIEELEGQLEKIEKAESDEGLEDDSIKELKSVLNKEIEVLQEKYKVVEESKADNDYITCDVKGKGGFYVKALDYTQAAKTDELSVKDENGKVSKVKKSDIKIID